MEVQSRSSAFCPDVEVILGRGWGEKKTIKGTQAPTEVQTLTGSDKLEKERRPNLFCLPFAFRNFHWNDHSGQWSKCMVVQNNFTAQQRLYNTSNVK